MEAPEKIIKRHPSAAWQEMDGRILVVTPKTKKIHILEGIGADVWRYIAQPLSVEVIVEKITSEYEVTEEQAQKDMGSFVSELEGKKLIC